MARPKTPRGGRRSNNERIRELVALLGSLSRTGDTVSIEAICERMGIAEDEARSMMDIVCQASGESIGGLLISANDGETEYTLQFPGRTGRPIRLTSAETIALLHALDVAGIDERDPLRARLEQAFSSADVESEEVRRALGSAQEHQEALLACARSIAESRSLSFRYQGMRDDTPRARRVLVRRVATEEGRWYAVALDLDLAQERTFRVDRMTSWSVGKTVYDVPREERQETRRVAITFSDPVYYQAFDWPGLEVVRGKDGSLVGSIPYYDNGDTWLIRRICAGRGSITVDDERIMQQVRAYAARQAEEKGE